MAKEELDAVSDLRYSWKKLGKCASEASDQLASLQVCPLHRCCCREDSRMHSPRPYGREQSDPVPQAGFRKELVKEVAAFVGDAHAFRTEWELQGPMVPGLDPMEAVDRLKKFQQLFEVHVIFCQADR